MFVVVIVFVVVVVVVVVIVVVVAVVVVVDAFVVVDIIVVVVFCWCDITSSGSVRARGALRCLFRATISVRSATCFLNIWSQIGFGTLMGFCAIFCWKW